MKSKHELVTDIDNYLHVLENAPEPWKSIASAAHADIHDLAAMISDNLEIRMSILKDTTI